MHPICKICAEKEGLTSIRKHGFRLYIPCRSCGSMDGTSFTKYLKTIYEYRKTKKL